MSEKGLQPAWMAKVVKANRAEWIAPVSEKAKPVLVFPNTNSHATLREVLASGKLPAP